MEPERKELHDYRFQNGRSKEYIKHYMSLQGSGKEQLNILEDYRDELVKQMHDVQRKLDCLDYLLFYKRTEV